MTSPWGAKPLRKTGLNELRLNDTQSGINNLYKSQDTLQSNAYTNSSKIGDYKRRQESLASDAMLGQQGRLLGQGGKRKSRRHRKTSRKHRKTRKTRRYKK